jgi:hypothetical protein
MRDDKTPFMATTLKDLIGLRDASAQGYVLLVVYHGCCRAHVDVCVVCRRRAKRTMSLHWS